MSWERAGHGTSALRSSILWLSVMVASTIAPGLAAGAGDDYDPGRDLYLKYCQSCHGPHAKGDGPVARELKTSPPDLTRLSERAGGKFPFLQTMEWIDGTTRMAAHGSSEMPVWGERFRAEAPQGMSAEARGKLLWITEYLRTIQQ